MTHVMFVDDEFEVLEGLRRNLRAYRNEWKLSFVTSAEHALQKLQAEPADVVVTDMQMTAMQGDELIDSLLGNYPETVPIVLSGYADPEIMAKLDAIGIRLLAKPCNTETLVETIRDSLERMAEYAAVAAPPASGAVFDGAADLEDYLLFLTEALIIGGQIEESTLPAKIKSRLAEYRAATNGEAAARPQPRAGLPAGRMVEIPVRVDDVEASRMAASGWVDMIHDKYAV